MHMVTHQTVRQDPRPRLRAMLRQAVQINIPVRVRKENFLLIDAPLRHVMRRFNCHDAGKSSHSQNKSVAMRISLWVP